MAEVSAFIYGWMAGIAAVIIWILYGIDTLLQLMRIVNDAFAHLPGLSGLANAQKERRNRGGGSSHSSSAGRAGESERSGISKFNVMATEEGLEGLTGSTKQVTPITAGGLCMMSWYGPDGTTGPPVECRLSLENNTVTIYQLLRLGDTNVNVSGSKGGAGGDRSSQGETKLMGSNSRRDKKDADTSPFRSAAGVTVAEHRKGRVSVLNTTVMELKHFNKPKKGAGESGDGGSNENGNGGSNQNNNGSKNKGEKASGSRKGGNKNDSKNGSEAGSANRSQKRSNGGADGDGSNADTPDGSKHKRKESGGGGSACDSAHNNNNNNNVSGGSNDGGQKNDDALADGVTRPGVDPLFTGRVLIWRTMDGRPLFDSNHAPRPSTGVNFLGNSLRRTEHSYGSMSQAGSGHSFSHSASYDSLSDDRSFNSSLDEGEMNETDDAHSDYNGGSEGSVDGHQSNSFNSFSSTTRSGKKKEHSGGRHSSHHRGSRHQSHSHKSGEMGDMGNWSCVIIKFERARESERWHTLLSGLREARAWHEFAKTLPNPDTINTFLSRFFFQNMRVNGLRDVIVKQIRKKLKELPSKKFPRSLGGQLELDEFLIGTQIPWITDVSEPTVSADGEVGFDFNLLYKGGEGGFTLFFRLALEFLGIRVPHVVFSVKLIELEATVHISIGPPPSKKFWIGGHKPPILRLEVHQGCASGKGILHRVLTSLPDLSGIMTNLIKLYLFSDMVLPYLDDFPLPSVVKSPKASQRDLRVRTFDRQRAALISSAPVRSSSAPVAAPPSPLPGHTPDPSKSKSKEADSNNSKSADSQGGNSRRASSSTSSPAAAAAAPVSPRSGNSSGAVASAAEVSAGLSGKATSDPKNAPISNTPQGDPAPAGGPGAEENQHDTNTDQSGNKKNNNESRNSFVSPSFAGRSVRDVSSPITFNDSGDPNSSTYRNTVHGSNPNGSSHNLRNTSTLSATNNDNNNSIARQSLLSEADLTESDAALNSSAKKRTGGSSTMRNLKNLLKVKGRDMTRESVSRSKSKRGST